MVHLYAIVLEYPSNVTLFWWRMGLIVLLFLFSSLNFKSTDAQITESLPGSDEQYYSVFEQLPSELFVIIMHEIMKSQQFSHPNFSEQKNRTKGILSLMSTNKLMKERVLKEGIIELLSQSDVQRLLKREILADLSLPILIKEFRKTFNVSQVIQVTQPTFNIQIRDTVRSITVRHPEVSTIALILPTKIIAAFFLSAVIVGVLSCLYGTSLFESSGLTTTILILSFSILNSYIDDFYDPLRVCNVVFD